MPLLGLQVQKILDKTVAIDHAMIMAKEDATARKANESRLGSALLSSIFLFTSSIGCSPIKPLDVTNYPASLSVLVCRMNAHDLQSSTHFKSGAAVCARTRSGRYIVITVRHLAFAANAPRELEFSRIDPDFGNTIGIYHPLVPYIAEIYDIPDIDLTLYVLDHPMENIPFIQLSNEIPDHGDVTAYGTEDIPTYFAVVRMIQGKLTGVSNDKKSLALTVHAHAGDSGGGVFLHGRLIGIMQSCGHPGEISIPFACDFSGAQTHVRFEPEGRPIKYETIAVAVTEDFVTAATNGQHNARGHIR